MPVVLFVFLKGVYPQHQSLQQPPQSHCCRCCSCTWDPNSRRRHTLGRCRSCWRRRCHGNDRRRRCRRWRRLHWHRRWRHTSSATHKICKLGGGRGCASLQQVSQLLSVTRYDWNGRCSRGGRLRCHCWTLTNERWLRQPCLQLAGCGHGTGQGRRRCDNWYWSTLRTIQLPVKTSSSENNTSNLKVESKEKL